MQTKKIISAGLLILIIIINLGFSMIFTSSSIEGLDIVQNPTDTELKQMNDILNDSTDNFTKIKKIYDIVKNNKISASIYGDISKNCLDTIIEYLKIAPIKDRDGKNDDENVISGKRLEKINGILASKSDPSTKVFEILPYICEESKKCDKKLSSIYNTYGELWIDSIKKYVAQFNSPNSIKNKDSASKLGYINMK